MEIFKFQIWWLKSGIKSISLKLGLLGQKKPRWDMGCKYT